MEMLKFFGFSIIAALLLIVLAKVVLQLLIRKPNDFYDKEEARQEDLMMRGIGEAKK